MVVMVIVFATLSCCNTMFNCITLYLSKIWIIESGQNKSPTDGTTLNNGLHFFFAKGGHSLPIGYYDTIKGWLSDSYSVIGQVWMLFIFTIQPWSLATMYRFCLQRRPCVRKNWILSETGHRTLILWTTSHHANNCAIPLTFCVIFKISLISIKICYKKYYSE